MRRAAAGAAHRIGRRGAVLALLGGIAALYGYALIQQPIPSRVGLELLLHVMPMTGWAATLIAAGCLAIVCALVRQGRDWPGYVALVVVWTPWSLSFLTSWWPLGDNPRGWISAAIFGALALIPAVAVGWPEPPEEPR